MDTGAWLLQIFKVSDQAAKQCVLSVFSGAPGLTVHSAASGSDHYVFVDSPDANQARIAYELVVQADPAAVLLHTSEGQTRPVTEQDAQPAFSRSDGSLVG